MNGARYYLPPTSHKLRLKQNGEGEAYDWASAGEAELRAEARGSDPVAPVHAAIARRFSQFDHNPESYWDFRCSTTAAALDEHIAHGD